MKNFILGLFGVFLLSFIGILIYQDFSNDKNEITQTVIPLTNEEQNQLSYDWERSTIEYYDRSLRLTYYLKNGEKSEEAKEFDSIIKTNPYNKDTVAYYKLTTKYRDIEEQEVGVYDSVKKWKCKAYADAKKNLDRILLLEKRAEIAKDKAKELENLKCK